MVTVQRQFEAAVTEMYQAACGGSSIENGTPLSRVALRQRHLQRELGTPAERYGRKDLSHLAMPALAPVHHPITSRCIVAQGCSLHDQPQRVSFTPDMQGGSTRGP